MHVLPRKQQGLSLSGLLVWSVILVMVAIYGFKIAPAYFEYSTIKKNLVAIGNEANTQQTNLNQIRTSFAKRAQIDNITSISSQDIKIQKEGNRILLSVDYTVKIPLAANVSLIIDFNAQSE